MLNPQQKLPSSFVGAVNWSPLMVIRLFFIQEPKYSHALIIAGPNLDLSL